MDSSKQIKEIFGEYTTCIDTELQSIFAAQVSMPMYKHLEYFMGFLDEDLNPIACYGGKRFRAGILLMLADWYGVKESAVACAASVELFHNFTLIHDDIVDGDVLRRGRPTVWKMFGTDHAINGGDAQLVLSLQVVGESRTLTAVQKVEIQNLFTKQYLKVIEGQHLDFTLTSALLGDVDVTQEKYLTMIARKTADLIASATMGAGVLADKSEEECSTLFEYGYNLGIAYQLCDDVVSIWGKKEQTGKQAYGDIFERKKTLPILRLFESVNDDTKQSLLCLYNSKIEMTKTDVQVVIGLLEEHDVYTYMSDEIQKRAVVAKEAAQKLSVTQEQKDVLKDVVDQLLPDIKNV